MKHLFSFFLALLICSCLSAQAIQGTLKAGSNANSVIIAIKSGTTFSGSITGINLTLQVPTSVTPTPTATIKTNFVESALPISNFATATTTGGGFTNFLFVNNPTGTPATNFVAGTEINLLEIEFGGGAANISSQVRLASLPGGGSNNQQYFFVEVGGAGVTNETAMFYGSSASNSASGFDGYSYATISGTLPGRFLNFSAVRQASNVIVTWGVGAEDAVNSYELEVSTNGSSFSRIAMKASQGSSSYDYIDQNVARYNAKKLYYRVKQLDKDGAFTYSPVKTIRLDVKGSIALYPNPAREGFTLNIPYLQANDQRVVLQLVNGAGQVLETKNISRQQALNYYYSISPSIPSGDYLLKIFEDNVLSDTKQLLITK